MKKFRYGFTVGLAAVFLTACAQTAGEGGYQISYVNTAGVRLVEESCTPETSGGTELVQELLDRMRVPQYSGDYHSAIPDDVEVQNISFSDKSVTLDFSSSYQEMDALTEIVMRVAVVETICQIPEVGDVSFTVDGQPLTDSTGAEVGKMTENSFIDTRGEGLNSYRYAALTLYFADSKGTQAVKEVRNVHYSTSTTLEEVVVEEVLSGPVDEDLSPIAQPSVKILGVSRKNGVCTVNLDDTFQEKPASGQATAETAVYSIVNALCDTCKVKKVQFQINGDSDVKFRDTLSLKDPFEKNEEAISQTEESKSGGSSIGVDQVIVGG